MEAKDIRKIIAGRVKATDKCLSKNVITEILTNTVIYYLTGECKFADKRQLRKGKKYSASSLALDLEYLSRRTVIWRRTFHLRQSGLRAHENS